MSAINQNGEPDDRRPPESRDGIESRSDGPARKEHIVNENHRGAVYSRGRNLGVNSFASAGFTQIIAKHRDIECANVYGLGFNFRDQLREAPRKKNASRWNAQED
jgi:hypothetical protein